MVNLGIDYIWTQLKINLPFLIWVFSGPLAQLVERFHGMEEATGSSPVRSTKYPNTILRWLNVSVGDRPGPITGCR